jgi:putative FmdB family regulatory protein
MPIYEYACPDCESRFEVRASISEAKAGLKPVCSTCGSKSGIRVFGKVAVVTGKKAASSGCSPRSGPGCCR